MSTHGIKYTTMAAALAVVGAAFQRTSDVYGTLNSQEANFRDLQQQVNAALALPEDPDPAAPPPPPPAPPDLSAPVASISEQVAEMRATLAQFAGKFDGIEDVLGVIVHSIPAPAPVATEEPAANTEPAAQAA